MQRATLSTALVLLAVPGLAQGAKQATPEAVKWFEDAKFGMFVHWGVYSVLGRGEWVMHNEKIDVKEYEKLPPKFNPVKFDAARWVAAAKGAGMRYITITSKHHDGFAMYDSKVSPYNLAAATPYKKDPLKMLADECQRQDMKLFFYYSHLDWHHPDYVPHGTGSSLSHGRAASGDWNNYKRYYMAQLDELCSGRYGPIAGIWFDGWWDRPGADWGLEASYDRIHAAQPQALIGNNHHHAPFPGEDFQMFEQDLPGANTSGHNKAKIASMPLEMCLTMNNTWGYNASDHKYKSTKDCVQYLVKAAGMGCNLLLNVGPRPDGTIQEEFQTHLAEIGRWLKPRGQSIYDTRRGPYAPADWGVSTQGADGTIYLHVVKLPADGKLVVNAPPIKIASVSTLLPSAEVPHRVGGGKLEIDVPRVAWDVFDTIVVLRPAKP